MLKTKKQKQDEANQHIHNWSDGFDASEQVCKVILDLEKDFEGKLKICGAILVSQVEYDRRIMEWNNYFGLVKTTDSYLDFQDMREAFFNKDSKIVQELFKRAKKRLEKDQYLPKPHFPDPSTWSKYKISS